jgi:hypothetical protein
MYAEELPFKVVRAAYETAIRMFPKDLIHYRNGAQIIARCDATTD